MNAPNSLADLHHRLGKLVADADGVVRKNDHAWSADKRHLADMALDAQTRPFSYATRAELAEWKATTPPERIAQLEAEWSDKEAAYEHARVKYGRGSSRYRAAVRAIERREFIAAHHPQPQEKRT